MKKNAILKEDLDDDSIHCYKGAEFPQTDEIDHIVSLMEFIRDNCRFVAPNDDFSKFRASRGKLDKNR